MHELIQQIAILFLMMLSGFIAAKAGVLRAQSRTAITALLFNIAQPALIISSFQTDFTADILRSIGATAIFSFVAMLVSSAVGYWLWRHQPDDKRRVLWFTSTFPNCGFMGFPVAQAVFGDQALIYVTIFVLAFNVLCWTLGVFIFTGHSSQKLWKIFMQPTLFALFLGLALFLLRVRLPAMLYGFFNSVGSMTTPMAMILTGTLLADIKWRAYLESATPYLFNILRLLVIPAAGLVAVRLLQVPALPAQICVLILAMPAAANTAIFASNYQENPQFAGQVVAISTLMSSVTLTGWLVLLRALY